MPVEAATFIGDFQSSNPPSGDPRGQGDDHIRMMKAVFQTQFPRALRAFPFPTIVAKTTNYTVLVGDDQTLFTGAPTGGPITFTLPAGLLAADAGWSIGVLKSNTNNNPIYVAPPSGTINAYPKIRVGVTNRIEHFVWTGTAFLHLRDPGDMVGVPLPWVADALPDGAGHLWLNGGTQLIADFPELADIWGTKYGGNGTTTFGIPNPAGRALFGADKYGGGAAAGVIQKVRALTTTTGGSSTTATVSSSTGLYRGMKIKGPNVSDGTVISVIDGTTLTITPGAIVAGTADHRFSDFADAEVIGGLGGTISDNLHRDQLAAHSHTGTTDAGDGEHSHPVGSLGNIPAGGAGAAFRDGSATNIGPSGAHTHDFTTAEEGKGQAHSKMPPAFLCGWITRAA